MSEPIRIHPLNPKCFEFRGAPRVLVCATEHYGAVLNRPFRFERYLEDAAAKSQTLTRLFVLFREQQHAQNPYSTCKPESTDYVSPYPRTGPGKAIDGLPRYDLDQWNPEFFDRLHAFLSRASDHGIVVEVVFLSNTYNGDIWALNPLNDKNNINDMVTIAWPEYVTMRHPKLFQRQVDLVCKVVEETNRYDNVFYEVCNEPGGNAPGFDDPPTPDEVDAWCAELAKIVRDTETDLPSQHLVAGQQAFGQATWEQPSDKAFHDFPVDVVNIHPLPNTMYGGQSYDMGTFMSKQLKLRALRDYCMATYHEPKPLNCDEDNVASRFKDVDGWTIHRKRAWTTLLCGSHYDYIDFSIIPGFDTGTTDSRRCIRAWMGHLSDFIHSVDLIHARPMDVWLREWPEHTLPSVLAVEGNDYCAYLADDRELSDPGVGEPIHGCLRFDLPEGAYEMACFSPVTGLYSPWARLTGQEGVCVETPEFRHDTVIRIRRR